uniref:Uncharacterized protein n=2 Tax=Attheya septentrionalis TaxID=420275 RepID=A0A7S2XNP6_9STRA|mmetsp:Transcript_22600/g.40789  ORF Transcript_22600/g.40789 Transcript_22600/m.40789 type:complete len:273 (+) Transcript_22600:156-974(+)
MASHRESSEEPTQQEEICPLTLGSLPTNRLEVAVLYKSNVPNSTQQECGHRCTLMSLVDYLNEPLNLSSNRIVPTTAQNTSTTSRMCPVCGEAPIVSVYDGMAAKSLSGETSLPIVAFRYGKQMYRLTVPSNDTNTSSWRNRIVSGSSNSSRPCTAQDRIAHVLGMRLSNNLKILHKGKVLYPDPKSSSEDVSEHLMDISKSDRLKKVKPSLVVMGTQIGKELHMNHPMGWFGMLTWGVSLVFRSFIHLFGGAFLFFRSILPSNDQPQNRDD